MRALAFLAFAIAGCGSSPNTYFLTQQVGGMCPTTPALVGTKAEGEACASSTECAPTCCSCDNGSANTWLAAACDGKCRAAKDICANTKDEGFCQ